MEFTYQSTMQLPASYAVLSEDEMVYTVGGAFELNIDRAAVAQFVTNVISNSIRLAGQYTFQMAFDGLTNMRNIYNGTDTQTETATTANAALAAA